MIVIYGSHGYIGSAFVAEMRARKIAFFAADYRTPELQITSSTSLVINCAAFIPKESVSLCDKFPNETMLGNAVLPLALAAKCRGASVPFAHISTGCLWSDGLEHSEDDPAQREFTGHCGFYIGVKGVAEGLIMIACPDHYIWRIRLPFEEFDNNRNYLSKLARMDEVWDHENTICHRRDFAKACLDLWAMRAPFGTYHVMNPGSIKATSVVEQLLKRGIRKTPARIVPGPQGGSRVSVKKLLDAGVKIRSVEDAVEDSLNRWKPAHV